VDEASEHFLTFRNPITRSLLSAQTAVMPFVAPYDVALLDDLPKLDVGRYRLVLVLNALDVPSALREAIRRRLCRDGRTMLWLHAPGLFRDGRRADEHMQHLTGVRIRSTGHNREGGQAVPVVPWIEGCDLPLVPGEGLRVRDRDATALAVTPGRIPQTVIAARQMPGWRSVYSAVAPLHARFLRALAKEAGVHLYTDSPRTLLFAGPHCLTVGADEVGGAIAIRLPRPRTVVDLETGASLGQALRHFDVTLRPGEVRLYSLQ